MPNVVFVAPFLLETTLRFIEATCALPDTRVCLVSQDPLDRVSESVREKLTAHEQIADALDPVHIAAGVKKASSYMGKIDRLLGALEELQVPLGKVREELGITGMSGATAHKFRDKATMKEVLRAAGLPCARHTRVASAEEAKAFAQEVGYPLIMKPTIGSGSRETFRVDDETRLNEVLTFSPPRAGGETMVEEFITGEEHSFDSVFLGGKLVWWSVSDYSPTPLEVLNNPWIQWCVVLPREIETDEYAEIRRQAEQALLTLGMVNGLSHMEWFRRPDGSVAISEVGARPPGAQFTTLMSYAHDIDLYRAWARLMVFDEFEPPERKYAAGAAFLRGQGRGRIKAIHGIEEVQKKVESLAVEVRLPRIGAPTSGTYDGDGYVIVRHPDTEVVREATAQIVQHIRVELG
jgi:formate-dependent phosphoribosylglycinamide formyltransferase (GAR transformylase)